MSDTAELERSRTLVRMARAAFLPFPLAGAAASNVIYLGAALCRRKFELFYPDGFVDETYLVAERSHKERAHLEWEAELAPATFRKLLARGEFRDDLRMPRCASRRAPTCCSRSSAWRCATR